MICSLVRSLAALLALGGCGSGFGDSSGADAGPDGGTQYEPTAPAPVEPVEPPLLAPCPAGWRLVTDGDDPPLTTCDPWPEGGPRDCAIDEAHFPGEPDCRRIGSDCPIGTFADDLPKGHVLYVLDGAVPGGDGSLASPFATLSAGVSAAQVGDVVALSKGTFAEAVVVRGAITIWGACVAETIVQSPDGVSTPLSLTTGGGATVGNLTVAGGDTALDAYGSGDPCVVDSVVVRDGAGVGIAVRSLAEMLARDVAVRDTALVGGALGQGYEVHGGAHLRIERGVVERSHTAGLLAGETGTEVVASDFAVRDTESRGDGDRGFGIEWLPGGTLQLDRAAIQRNRSAGLYVTGPDTTVRLTDVVIRATRSRDNGELGYAMQASVGASVEATRVWMDRNYATSIVFAGAETSLVATDTVVTGPDPGESADVAYGMDQQEGVVTFLRVAILRTSGTGLMVGGDGTALDATDVSIRDVGADGEGGLGYGLNVRDGASAGATRVEVASARTAGVLLTNGRASLTDLVVEGTRPHEIDGAAGFGMFGQEGSEVTIERGRFAGNQATGLVASGGTAFTLSDLVVDDTASEESSGIGGFGIWVQDGSSATLARGSLSRNHRVALGVSGNGSAATVEDVVVEETGEQACASTTCPGEGGGTGLGAFGPSSMTVTRLRVSRNLLCGVQISGGEIDLHEGEVSYNAIGANVVTPDFDVARLEDGVVFRENGVALDATALPVPQSFAGITE